MYEKQHLMQCVDDNLSVYDGFDYAYVIYMRRWKNPMIDFQTFIKNIIDLREVGNGSFHAKWGKIFHADKPLTAFWTSEVRWKI